MVILLLFTVFLAYCSVNLLLAWLWNLFGEFLGTRILSSSASFFWNFIPHAEALDSALFLFPALFKTFLPTCKNTPSSETHASQLYHLWPFLAPSSPPITTLNSTENFSIFLLVFLFCPIVPVPKRMSPLTVWLLTSSTSRTQWVTISPIITAIPQTLSLWGNKG